MDGRGFFRVFAALVLVALTIGIGVAAYNAGVTAGLAEAAQQAAAGGDPIPVNPYAWGYGGPYVHGPFGWGFGFFGFLFVIFMTFIVIGLVRAAFGGGRRGGPGPGGGWGDRRNRIEEWHQELHRREGGEGGEGEQRPAGA
ncbi:MAG TPA: hypothetical protein VF365_03460 [Candidatus Limnocylindria bacterium]